MAKEPEHERPMCPICIKEMKDKDIGAGYSFWDERAGKLGDPSFAHLACAVGSSVGEQRPNRKARNYRGLLKARWIAIAARRRFLTLKRIDKRIARLREALVTIS